MSLPLHQLRKWVIEGHIDDIVEENNSISYGGVTLPLDQRTEYVTSKSANKEVYTLQQIWFLLRNKNITYTDYMTMCRENGQSNVKFTDKKNIIEWLEGTKKTIDGIAEHVEEEPEAEEAVSESQPPASSEVKSSTQTADIEAALPPLQVRPEEKAIQPTDIEIKLDSTVRDVKHKLQQTIEYEKIRSIDSILLCPCDFSEMLHINEVIKRLDSINSKKEYANDNQGLNGFNGDSIMNTIQQKSQFQNYIILVSRARSGLINNSNIEEFLTNSTWVPPTETPEKKHFIISHNHIEKMRLLKYDIVSDESMLTDSDWNKVVAIFIIGKVWQIRNYKPNDPQTLFQKILGIYVR